MIDLQTTPSLTSSRLVPRSDLRSRELADMYQLFAAHFDGVTEDQFVADLQEKNWVILIERDRTLVGFTTILAYETVACGETVSIIYSGDTIVSPQAWNGSTLPKMWIESVAALRREFSRGRYLWLLITSGFRTYRFLPLFWREFHPRFDRQTPPHWQNMLNHLAANRFGLSFDESSGIVRFPHPQRLKAEMAGIPASRLKDPHIDFFTHCNPNHAAGDELVCLCELQPENLTPAGRRMASTITTW